MTLRPYQQMILENVRRGWADFRRQLVVAPTGSGKTICFSRLAADAHSDGLKSLILVDQEELVWQAIEKLKAATGITAEAEKAEHRASHDAPVVVATVQSMIQRLDQWPAKHFGLTICDEADKSITDSWQSVLKHFDSRVCGFTATPNRTDRRNLGCFYENVAAEIGLFELINQGYLAPVSVKMMPIRIDLSAVRVKAGDFDAVELDSIITPHLEEVARAIVEHASFRKVLVFLPLIRTSQKFAEICNAVGLRAEHIDGTSEDRSEKLSRFGKCDFDVLTNSALLTRGYDDQTIDCVVMLRPTKSVTLYMQCIGRGTRVHPTKENLLLLDFLYQSTKHRIVRPAHLIAKTEEEAEAITNLELRNSGMPAEVAEALDLQELANTAGTQREADLRKKLDAQKDRKAKTVSAEEFALQHGSMEAAEYEPTMPWESAPATEKQLKYLQRAKIDLETVKSKGHASRLLSLYFGSKPLTLASHGQRGLMARMGHPNADNATADEARKFFAGLNKTTKTPRHQDVQLL